MTNKIKDLQSENLILKEILNEIRQITNCPIKQDILKHIKKNVKQENKL